MFSATAFLYSGTNPIQTGVTPGTIDAARVSVLRGKVQALDGTPLSGVKITVLAHPEFGQTISRADGAFDLAVNGGGQLTVRYEKAGLIASQRNVVAPWRGFATLPDAVMIAFDTAVTAVTLGATAMQTARGSPQADADGARRATVLFPAGTTAVMVMANGSTQPLTTLNVRATEFTTGPSGPKAMPAPLPANSAYTYAVELSVDEVVAAGGTEVRFSQPLPVYVENFLGFPVGSLVPAGYLDRQSGQWVASANGRVIKLLGITNNLADLDTDGDGLVDDTAKLAALGVTTAERANLALLYTAGQTLWRVPLTHFTPWDFNWPFGPPQDAVPPTIKKIKPLKLKKPKKKCGSIISCQDQTLGESVPVSGTPFSLRYQSERTPGNQEGLTIPLTGATIPASLRRVELEISIAGRQSAFSFGAAANLTHAVVWDGRDAYGRSLHDSQAVTVRVGYTYGGVYQQTKALADSIASAAIFGHYTYLGVPASGNQSRMEVTLWQEYETTIERWDNRALGLGTWNLNIQHAYDPNSQTLRLGDGTQRQADALSSIITTVAGNGVVGYGGDNGPATAAPLGFSGDFGGLVVGPDGSLYIGESGSHRVRRVSRQGIITTIAGTGLEGFSGDGGPALNAMLDYPDKLMVGRDGSLYVADFSNRRIRRIGVDGVINTVAGNGGSSFSGNGASATATSFARVFGMAMGPDGSYYIANGFEHQIHRVGPDGIVNSIAGVLGARGYSGDGGLALAANLFRPEGVAVGPDGSVYIADSVNSRIRRVSPAGIITTYAGNGDYGTIGDGGPATAANLSKPTHLAIGADGTLYVADNDYGRIRQVGTDGIISSVAGTGTFGFSGDGGPAMAARLGTSKGMAVGPDRSLYIADGDNNRIRRIAPLFPGFTNAETLLTSEDGREIYIFNSSFRHTKTIDALTGAVRYQFGYSAAGYLTSVTDGSGNVTTIERTGEVATAIVSPGGKRTVLNVSTDGWLTSVTNPAGKAHVMSYSPFGLMQTFTDPRGKVHQFTYDTQGRLTRDDDPAGGSTTLARSEQANGYTVTTTSALGRVESYQMERLPAGAIRSTAIEADGTKTITLFNTDGSEQTTNADGSTRTLTYGPDPRWGMLAPVPTRVVETTPGGRTRTVTTVRTATLSDPTNILSLTNLTDTITDNGVVSSRVFSSNGANRTLTVTAGAGRSITLQLDALGRTTQAQLTGLDPISYTYGSHGLISTVTEGTGAGSRTTTLAYNAADELTNTTDAAGRLNAFTYDSAGSLITATLPGTRTVSLAYDASSNAAAITPPGRGAHAFDYTAIDQIAGYTPPTLGAGNVATQYTYNTDRALTRITRPDGQLVDVTYDTAGRPSAIAIARGSIGYAYSASTGRLTGITAPGGLDLSYTRDSSLLTGVTWSGAVTGTAAYTYNNDLRVTAESINAANSVAFTYDADGLLTQAGNLTLTRNAQSGLITGSTLGGITDSHTYNTLAEHASSSTSYNSTAIYNAVHTRDALGRITQTVETIGGVGTSYGYSYDAAGRLAAVSNNAAPVSTYSYDINGNRTARTGPSLNASHDAQDRLTGYGSTSYSYTANGELLGKVVGVQTAGYQYDALGNLISVTLPGGSVVDYLIDGQNRRIGKKVNGSLVQGFLYQDSLRPIAELNSSNAVVSRFVYATRVNVPDYMIKDGTTYRIITNQLGSPRLVVDVATGTVAQRIDYDEFGQISNDTNPGFQPFGFAGGLYDQDTKLVRFGARDYDAETGRWTAKDPIGFGGLDTNLYAYAGNDPVNFIDSTGLAAAGACLTVKSKDTKVLKSPDAAADRALKDFLEPGDIVKYLEYDRDTGFVKVEVTLPGGDTVVGYVLRQNLTTNPVLPTIDAGSGKPLSSQSYPSAGVGIKG